MTPLSGSITMESAEFRRELEQANNDLLANRLKWYAVIRGGVGLLWLAAEWISLASGGSLLIFRRYQDLGTEGAAGVLGPALVDGAWVLVYAITAWATMTQPLGRATTLRLSMLLILVDGLYGTMMHLVGADPGIAGVYMLMATHAIAACIFPWTAWQAAKPVLIAWLVMAARRLINADWSSSAVGIDAVLPIFMYAFVPVPGIIIALLLHSRRTEQYRYRFLRTRYGRLREELAYARRIHESLFPEARPSDDSRTVGFSYEYEPMRQIGGDFLFARGASELDGNDRDRRFSVVVLDVTGHGIPAALTVNRLHGELELLYAQNPAPDPADVMRALNHYVHLTLAKHSIYVTGLCLRVDPDEGVLDYSNSGHPPFFLRSINGTVQSLESTSFVLGACAGGIFDPGQQRVEFLPGDAVVAYTDGATEARNEGGRMLTVEGLRRLVAESPDPGPGAWSAMLLRDVEAHRAGHVEDDTLFVELYLPARTFDSEAPPPPVDVPRESTLTSA